MNGSGHKPGTPPQTLVAWPPVGRHFLFMFSGQLRYPGLSGTTVVDLVAQARRVTQPGLVSSRPRWGAHIFNPGGAK